MSSIIVYSTIKDATTLHFTGVIKENVSGIDWKKTIILRGGRRVDENYEVKENDVIFIRKLPAAGVSLVTVAIITGVVSLVVGGVALGISLYNQKKANAQLDAANRAAKAANEKTDALPFIRGARNAAATGQTFPYIIGKTLYTPLRLCPHHYAISGAKGEKQYTYFVFETGFNDLIFEKIKMGETVIKSFTDTTPQNGSYNWDAGTFYDAENKIEIRQSAAFTDNNFNKKIIAIDVGKEIPHEHGDSTKWKDGVIQEMPAGTMRAEIIALFDGLRRYNDGWESETVTLRPQWTNANNPTESDWNDFSTGFIQNGTASNTFTYNSKEQMRFVAAQDFTAAQAYGNIIKLRVLRTTAKEESNARDSVYFLAAQATIYDDKKSSSSNLVAADVLEDDKRERCCRMGIRVIANDNTDGMTDQFSVVVNGVAQTWNGSSWTSARTGTRNLAAWVREIMISDKHGPSMYDAAELDADTFGAWYEYCEQQGFNADGVICKPTRKRDTLNTLCANGNAALVYNPATGKIEVAIDNGRDYSVALLNSDTLRTITTTKKLQRKADGIKAQYVNAAAEYDTDSVIFMRDGGAYDPETDIITEAALQYITEYAHAYKYIWRQMAEESAQPRTAIAHVGFEGAYYPIFDRVDVEHKTITHNTHNVEISGVTWAYGLLDKITLSAPLAFDSGRIYGLIANIVTDTGRAELPIKVSVSGSGTVRTATLNVESDISQSADIIPHAGDYGSIGELDADGEFTTVVKQMKIVNAEETDDGYNLTLVDYNPAVYEYGTMPDYKSNITVIPQNNVVPVKDQRETITMGEAQALNSGTAQAAVDAIHGTKFTNVYKIRDSGETLEEIIAKIDDDARNTSASISISETEILLQVQDVERELIGLIDIQAGSVSALVAGGGATGQLSLSLQLPVIIDGATRDKLIEASTETKVNAVYGLITGTENYGIKGNATNAAVKSLWDDAVAANLIASQIDLSATQINIAAEHVKITSGTGAGQTIIDDGKIRASLIDTLNLIIRDGGSIQSENFIQDTSGWKIFSNGSVQFFDGYFRGLLDCAVMKVSKDNVKVINAQYTTDQTDGFARYINELFPVEGTIGIWYEKTIIELFGNKNYVVLNDTINITSAMRARYGTLGTEVYFDELQADINGTWTTVFKMTSYEPGRPYSTFYYTLYYNYKQIYEQEGVTVLKFSGLPVSDPHDNGRAWVDNGTLKISQG